jgi:glycosyltransferase involved in cell wall biosynthesis
MSKCLYSIITVCLNNEQGMARTSQSIQMQRYENFEWIVIDGASEDNSVAVAQQNSALTHLVSEPDDGIYHAMNKGISLAQGEYCLFLNSGDWLYADTVLAEAATQLQGDLVAGWLTVIYPEQFHKTPKLRRLDLQDVRKKFLYHRTLHHQATFIKRNLFKRYGVYDKEYKIYGDWDFFLRVINKGASLGFIKICIANYKFDGISSTKLGTELSKKEIRKVRRRHFSLFYRFKRSIIDPIETILNKRGFYLLRCQK